MLNARSHIFLTCSQAYPVVASRWSVTCGIKKSYFGQIMWQIFSKNIPPWLVVVVSLWNPDFSLKNGNNNYFLSTFPRREAENLAPFSAD